MIVFYCSWTCSSVVERCPDKTEVGGSIPPTSTKLIGFLKQKIETVFFNRDTLAYFLFVECLLKYFKYKIFKQAKANEFGGKPHRVTNNSNSQNPKHQCPMTNNLETIVIN